MFQPKYYLMATVLIFTNSRSPHMLSSTRPEPEFFTPPNGSRGSEPTTELRKPCRLLDESGVPNPERRSGQHSLLPPRHHCDQDRPGSPDLLLFLRAAERLKGARTAGRPEDSSDAY
jgi:hypothetical protein